MLNKKTSSLYNGDAWEKIEITEVSRTPPSQMSPKLEITH